MLAKPTVLVLGAGASAGFGLPVGAALACQIRDSLTLEFDGIQTGGSRKIGNEIIRIHRNNSEPFIAQARSIANALPGFRSIDDCLHTHRHNDLGVLAGKMAIAENIARAENESDVSHLFSHKVDVANATKQALWRSWVGQLLKILISGIDRCEYRNVFSNLKVISFNYDRCFQAIAYHLVKDALDLDEQEAGEAISGLSIMYPYGTLGALPLGGPGVSFGGYGSSLTAATKNIFLYTEKREQLDSNLNQIKSDVYHAERLVFLGFGFHKQNIELLASSDIYGEIRGKDIFGTVKDESGPSVEVFKRRLGIDIGVAGPLKLENGTCEELLARYSVVLGE